MRMIVAAAALIIATASAHAMSDRYLAAFIRASDTQPQGGWSFPADMNAGAPVDDVYKCLPELRAFCHDVLTGIIKGEEDTTVHEWGEWRDAYGNNVEALKAEAQSHVDDAADRGFNLLTNAELEAALKD